MSNMATLRGMTNTHMPIRVLRNKIDMAHQLTPQVELNYTMKTIMNNWAR